MGYPIVLMSVLAATLSLGAAERKFGVFIDAGSRSGGAIEWVRLATYARPAAEVVLLDGADVKAGRLEGLDLLIMPGGSSPVQTKRLGEEGREQIRRYLRNGGHYLGSCAGLSILQNVPGLIGIVPYAKREPELRAGDATLPFEITVEGANRLGVKAGNRIFCYHSGPQLVPHGEVPDCTGLEVIARFAGSVDQFGRGTPPLKGLPAGFFGHYGKGTFISTAFHPEYFPTTWDFVASSMGALTGVKTEMAFPRKNPRAIKVVHYSIVTAGKADARAAMELSDDPDIALFPISDNCIDDGFLELADVIVVPGGEDWQSAKFLPARAAELKAFLARGGRIVTYGDSARYVPAGATVLASGEGIAAAVKGLYK